LQSWLAQAAFPIVRFWMPAAGVNQTCSKHLLFLLF
jgi:hypothetical protein